MEIKSSDRKSSPFIKANVWIPTAVLCAFLWGSAFPSIKLGYELFNVNTENAYSILLFAGYRFALAGILTLIISVFITKKFPIISVDELKGVTVLGFLQTALQYTFFYVSLSNTTGINGAIIGATSGFIAVIIATIYYKNDRMTTGKALGCIMGFVGIIVLNIGKGEFSTNFSFNGEFFMLIASFLGALGVLISKELTSKTDAFVVTGYQLFIGGAVLVVIGLLGGGSLDPEGVKSIILLGYMALLSCIAFSLWTTLMKYHPMTKISIFHTLIPVFGSILSIMFLGEKLRITAVLALILIVSGIFILNRFRNKK